MKKNEEKLLTLVGGGFSSGKSDRRGASLSPTSLTSLSAGAAAARAATEGEEEEEEEEERRQRRPKIGAALVAAAFREADDGAACTPRMLMVRILTGSRDRIVCFFVGREDL